MPSDDRPIIHYTNPVLSSKTLCGDPVKTDTRTLLPYESPYFATCAQCLAAVRNDVQRQIESLESKRDVYDRRIAEVQEERTSA